MVAYYRFDDPKSIIATDASGHGHMGVHGAYGHRVESTAPLKPAGPAEDRVDRK